jgi:sugar (pentulose or hexulose) kinase
MNVFLGLDLGTTNCKVVAVDHQGQIVANASAPTPVHSSSEPGITEYDAEMLWTVIARLVRQVIEKLGPEQKVSGLAVASMTESGVLSEIMLQLSDLAPDLMPPALPSGTLAGKVN